MLNVYVAGDPWPPGGVPHAVDDGPNRWVFAPYAPNSVALGVVRDAIELIRHRVVDAPRTLATCNVAFQHIRGVSFDDLFTSPNRTVTIYRSWDRCGRNAFGLTQGQGLSRHITLSRNCWGRPGAAGVLRTAATIVHELAHCAGAGGESMVAENTLIHCGFADQYNPHFGG